MSSHGRAILAAVCLLVSSRDAFAQNGQSQAQPTAEEIVAQQRADLRQILQNQAEECEADEWQPNVIVVCRKINQTREYMSVLPKPVDIGRMYVPGFEPPPCNGICIKFGSVPEYPPLIDMTAFPEALAPEVAAAIITLPAEEPADTIEAEEAGEVEVEEAPDNSEASLQMIED